MSTFDKIWVKASEYLNIALCSLVVISAIDSLAIWPIMLAIRVDPSKSFLGFLFNCFFCAFLFAICTRLRPVLSAVLFYEASSDRISESNGTIHICLKAPNGSCLHHELTGNHNDAVLSTVCAHHVSMLGFLAKMESIKSKETAESATTENNQATDFTAEIKQEPSVVLEMKQEVLVDTPSTTPALSSPKEEMTKA